MITLNSITRELSEKNKSGCHDLQQYTYSSTHHFIINTNSELKQIPNLAHGYCLEYIVMPCYSRQVSAFRTNFYFVVNINHA